MESEGNSVSSDQRARGCENWEGWDKFPVEEMQTLCARALLSDPTIKKQNTTSVTLSVNN